jgi:cellulose synthase/poly-beta-1,6-N-acetylglucosamine synthase-like glycosyltransferase
MICSTYAAAVYYAVLGGLTVFCLHRLFLVRLYYRAKGDPRPAPAALEPLPPVTVQLPIYNEKYVVERLIAAAGAIDYPRHLLEIQVLDDSTDETREIAARLVAARRAEGIDIHHIRRPDRRGYKAGALAFGLERAKGEFVAVFDADFIPPPDFLRRTIHHFSDPGIGMVQARWDYVNRNHSLLTRAQAMLLDGHFVIEHTARQRSGRFFNFNGTAGIWRTAAIDAAGGWQHDTLTEDLDLSYRAQLRGWRFVYLPELAVPSELPVDMNAFKTQQHRWAKGSVETCRKLLGPLLAGDLPAAVKLEAVFHLAGNFAYLLVLILALAMYPSLSGRMHRSWPAMLALDLPLFGGSFVTIAIFYLSAEREIGRLNREAVLLLPLTMALGIGLAINNTRAVIEALLDHRTPFIRTPKLDITKSHEAWRHKAYRCRQEFQPLVEIALAAHFAFIMVSAAGIGRPAVIPFLLLFLVGFGMSGFLSLRHNPAAA